MCVVMSSSNLHLGKWKLTPCIETHGFICQRKVDSSIPVPDTTVFPRNWISVGNDSYKLQLQNLTWSEAQMQCEYDQGQLASTMDQLSTAYLELQVLKLQTPVWIGLNKNETHGYFKWIDGWHLNMVQWAPNEPSRERPCVYLDVDGTWKTDFCNHTYPSVCKQSTVFPPTYPPPYPGECYHGNDGTFWLPFRGHCYGIFTEEMLWTAAATSCMEKGAMLVSIEDTDELDFLKRNLEFIKDSYSSFWIGLYKTHLGQWKWVDETVLDFTNWLEGELRDSDINIYVHGNMLSSDGSWKAGLIWDEYPYICKKPKVLTETPTSQTYQKPDLKRGHYGLVVVVLLAAVCLMGLTAAFLYKSGHVLRSVSQPLVLNTGWRAFNNPLYSEPVNKEHMVDSNTVDSSQLVDHMEEEPQLMVTM
ncbi:hypothetical protein DPEC_G00053750 [Dallia pectoralis]|uniref:Uncharacterized protein n=1 Tax=Dallia pectoralis TaxID=75939 RepID=A0ACC2H4U5_DALPE|nr:hypothetical protein DPEC_G00053750 [Dallia pectoralis]